MKRYPVLLLFLAALAGYFGYRWFRSGPPEVWKYIPGSASVIISSDKLQDIFNPAPAPEDDTVSARYRDLPLVSLAAGTLSVIRWFNQDPDQVYTFLKDKIITYAFHPLAGNRLGIVMYLPVKSELEKKWLGNPKTGTLRVSSHHFQGHTVTDISNERSEALFSYIIKDNYLVISQYGELIEDVIRSGKSGGSALDSPEGFTALREETSDLSLYANSSEWRNFVFSPDLPHSVSAFLDLMPARYGFHLEPTDSPGQLSLLSEDTRISESVYDPLLSGQEGLPFGSTPYISQQTTYLIRMAVKNEGKFGSAYRKWVKGRYELPAVSTFNKMAGDEKDLFFNEIHPEIMLCVNESGGGISDGKIMLIRYGDFEKTKPVFRKITDLAGNGEGQTAGFQGYEIYPVAIPELMEGLFGPLFKGFHESHITYIQPYLVVGNSAGAIRNYLIDYENQLTWMHSPGLDSARLYENKGAQLSLVANMSKARAEAGSARTGLKTSLDGIETAVLNYRRHGSYANLALALNYAAASGTRNLTELKADLEWKDGFPSVFSAMSSPSDGTSEILLTNRNHQLIRISDDPSAKPAVLAQLDGPLTGRAYKADFLNIGRQQRIVSTPASVYLIDEDDAGLVTVLSDHAPATITSVYRMNESKESGAGFILRGADQNLYLWEKPGKPPFRLNTGVSFENILGPVVSFARGNSNVYIVTQANGKVFALDGNGSVRKGFPADMLSGIRGAFGAVQNSAEGQAGIVGVTRQGEWLKTGLDGSIITKKQLLLPEAGCTFRTLYDESALDWLLLRQTRSKAAILNKEGKEIFEIVNLKPDFTIRYHYFGSDNRFISVVSGEMASIFDFNGNRIGDAPIPCKGALGLTYRGAGRELSIFSQVEEKIRIWSVKL